MKKFIHLSFIGLLAFALTFSSCKKKSDETDFDTSSAQDQNTSEGAFDQVFKQVDQSATNSSLGKGGGPVITIDTTVTPRKMTIDFGPAPGMLCDDGKTRSGQLLVTWTGKYRAEGTVITVGFNDFIQEGHQINNSSSKTITNNGRDANNHLNWTINVNASITLASGQHISWVSTRTRTWIAGESTPSDWHDDKYNIEGTTTGVSRNGNAYTCNITKTLLVDLSCTQRRITSGVVELTPEGKKTRVIDFGDGTCDQEVTVTVNGKIFKIGKI